MIGVPLPPRSIADLVERHGGALRNGAKGVVRRFVPVGRAAAGDLTVLLHARYAGQAVEASKRGALVLVDASLETREELAPLAGWFHAHAAWAMAEVLQAADAPENAPVIGPDCRIGQGVLILPRVQLGARVTIAPGAVIGAPGFGFAVGPDGASRDIPQLGGVIIEDDVHIGALCTIASGTIGPTVIRRGAKLDAQVHVGHNCEIGAHTIIAAQSGLAGSVTVGREVLIGGQVGIAEHLTIGDRARIAAKSGVIGDVADGVTVAGYPAVERQRWLRGLAELYRLASGSGARRLSTPPRSTPPVRAGLTNPPFDPARAKTMPAPPGEPTSDVPPSVRNVPPIPRTD